MVVKMLLGLGSFTIATSPITQSTKRFSRSAQRQRHTHTHAHKHAHSCCPTERSPTQKRFSVDTDRVSEFLYCTFRFRAKHPERSDKSNEAADRLV